MQEKRISVRTDLLGVEARVSEDNKNWISILVRDISDNGIGFTAEKELKAGTKLILEGSVSDHVKHLNIGCDLSIMFAGKTPEGKFLYGGKFLNLEKVRHTELSIFIEMMVTKYPPLLQE